MEIEKSSVIHTVDFSRGPWYQIYMLGIVFNMSMHTTYHIAGIFEGFYFWKFQKPHTIFEKIILILLALEVFSKLLI